MKYKACLLTTNNPVYPLLWKEALEASGLFEPLVVVDITANDWLQQLNADTYNLFLLRPPGKTNLFKQLYDERVHLAVSRFDVPCYPSLLEVRLYENKRYLRDWLMVHRLPHPDTFVFFDRDEAFGFIRQRKEFPLVGKTNIGASGNGVVVLRDSKAASDYVARAFAEGLRPRSGPKVFKGSLIAKIRKAITMKGFLKNRLKTYATGALNVQYHFVILQRYVPHQFEWRCVRIGDSFFAHKKLAPGGMASGTLLKGYDAVPPALLDFLKRVTDSHQLTSVAVDLFEDGAGGYLINEIQCYFGQSDPWQMLVDGKPGRYVWSNLGWVFEEGMFNTRESYDLRVEHAVQLLKSHKVQN